MFNQSKQFRRPDGTLYDPSSFNVGQFEDEHGPGGVPAGWSMAATTPVQSPVLITALAVVLTFLSLGMVVFGVWAIGGGEELTTILFGFGVGAGGMAMSVQAFRIAAKRRRWLRSQQHNAGQER